MAHKAVYNPPVGWSTLSICIHKQKHTHTARVIRKLRADAGISGSDQ